MLRIAGIANPWFLFAMLVQFLFNDPNPVYFRDIKAQFFVKQNFRIVFLIYPNLTFISFADDDVLFAIDLNLLRKMKLSGYKLLLGSFSILCVSIAPKQ